MTLLFTSYRLHFRSKCNCILYNPINHTMKSPFIDKWLSLSIPNRNKTERMTPNIKCYKLPKSRIVYWVFSCHAKHRYIRDIIVIRARNFDLESVNGSNSRIIHKLHETIIWMGCREYGDSICRQCSFDQMIYIIRHLWCCCNQSITA